MAACGADPDDWGFGTFAECVAECRAVPPAPEGKYVDVAGFGDTLACRLYHASAATLDPGGTSCNNAHLSPRGPCVGQGAPSCDDYCRAVDVACPGELAVYESSPQCKSVCAELPEGNRTDSEGNTLGCRITHIYNALVYDPVHCNHVGPVGDAGCKDNDESNCASYCKLAASACPDQFKAAFGGGEAQCMSKCSALPDARAVNCHVEAAEKGGNSLECRLLHAARALATDLDERDDAVCAPIFGAAPCR